MRRAARGALALLVLAGALVAALGACPPAPAPRACACADAGTRLDCRGAGLQHLPPLNEDLLSL